MERSSTGYSIKLPHFEGPFDLLLFFIERDELDIYDIPIARVTNDFLEYIRSAQTADIDLASEFILVAATLMRIKAKILIPRKMKDEAGNEIDPRAELVERLLEYKTYKSVLDALRNLEEERAKRNPRGNITFSLTGIADRASADQEMESVSLYKLHQVFQKIMLKYESEKTRAVHRIIKYNYTIQEQQAFILLKMAVKGRVVFEDLFKMLENRIHAVTTFLALLELLSRQKIQIVQGSGVNNFWVSIYNDKG